MSGGHRWRVDFESVPGVCAQYAPSIVVVAPDEATAIDRAYQRLRRGAFPDRTRDMWTVAKVLRWRRGDEL